MSKLIALLVFSVFATIVIWGLRAIFKDRLKVEAKTDSNIEDIDAQIVRIDTVEECIALQKQIQQYHKGTDPLYKDLRQKYANRYYMIDGIRYAIEKRPPSKEKENEDL